MKERQCIFTKRRFNSFRRHGNFPIIIRTCLKSQNKDYFTLKQEPLTTRGNSILIKTNN